MNQDKHLFQFTGQQVADACAAEVAYRKERIAFWEAEQEKQVERAKSDPAVTATVKVREWQHTSGKGYEVYADLVGVQDVNARLRLCGEKLYAHNLAVEQYELKGAAYGTQPTRSYEFDPSDVAYFKLNGAKHTD
jgi:hypothetical protein